jgi:hypothetical protein
VNSYDSAVARLVAEAINDEITRISDGLLSGAAADYTEYRQKIAGLNAYRNVLTLLADVEKQLKS